MWLRTKDERGTRELCVVCVVGTTFSSQAYERKRPSTRANSSDLEQSTSTVLHYPPVEFHVSLVGRKDLSGEIYRQLRRVILEGRLRPGDALPPTRELARSLSVSRTTVTVAYDRLWGEGLVTSRVGAGTFVSEQVSMARYRATRDQLGSSLQPRSVWRSIAVSTAFARPAKFDFRTGLADASLFPYETWRRLMAHHLRAEAVGTEIIPRDSLTFGKTDSAVRVSDACLSGMATVLS
jgi:DNA-binding transcriptional regulator YhcF (GntR family)